MVGDLFAEAFEEKPGSAHLRVRVILTISGVFALGIIPGFTLLLGSYGSPLTTSLSAIGNSPGMRTAYLTWAIVLCAYYVAALYALSILTGDRLKRLRVVAWLIAGALLGSSVIPFYPDEMPGWAFAHEIGSKLSAGFLVLAFLLFTLSIRISYPRLFRRALVLLVVIVAAAGIPYLFFSASWISTGPGLIGAGLFLFLTMFWLVREDDFDPEAVFSTKS
ncbi:MAG: hypothetical protein LBE83_08835 [Propionibacteriaceae bacterium]|jgi:hypothetical protein|nr:hypothetical protein [Propionibacteriaceae bacterium]